MTEWEIADLNKIPRDHPNYRELLDAVLQGLSSRDHPIEQWRPFTKLYMYSHEGHTIFQRRESEERVLQATKDLSKSKHVTVVVKKEHTVLKSLQQEIKNIKTLEKNVELPARRKKFSAKLKANRKNTDALNKGIGIMSSFWDAVVDKVAAFETLTEDCEEQDQQEFLADAKALKIQCQQHHTVFTALLQKDHPAEST